MILVAPQTALVVWLDLRLPRAGRAAITLASLVEMLRT